MATKKPVAKKRSGGGRIKDQGRSLIWVTLNDPEKKRLRAAAGFEDLAMGEFLRRHGMEAAERVLKKNQEGA